MASTGARSHPWIAMRDHELPGRPPARGRTAVTRRELIRIGVLLLSLGALLLTSSALNLVASTRAQSPKRAVIVSGPVHSLTDRYLAYARAMADAAEAQGMEVTRSFTRMPRPSASRTTPTARISSSTSGTAMGWPSARPARWTSAPRTAWALTPPIPRSAAPLTVVYKGADWLRENIEFAPNAVVILSHLSYASGNASSGMPIPSREVAVERVDNFATGSWPVARGSSGALGSAAGRRRHQTRSGART